MSTAILPNSAATPLAPSPHWDEASQPAHTVHFYADDNFFLDELSRFLGTALVAGDAAVVIASAAHRDGLAQRLQDRDLDITRAVEQGRYLALDADDTLATFMLDASPDPTLFADTVGRFLAQAAAAARGKQPHVAAFGEMVAHLWQQGYIQAAVQLEHLWNHLLRLYPVSLRCAYPMSSFNRGDHSELFLKICAEHSYVLPTESYSAMGSNEQRLRSVSYLQQKAQALETEMAERKQVEETLRRAQAQLESTVAQRTMALRQLSSRLLSLQDTERRRIARELHDSLGQYLVGLKLNLETIKQASQSHELWSEADRLMQQCMSEVRTLSYLLHPPTMDAAGFASAARWFVEGFGQRSGVSIGLDLPDDLGRLPDAVELALFRVLQEALTNVHRHSGASEAHVLIRENAGQIILDIRDNGCGIPERRLTHFHATGAGMGVGLAGIRERAWELGGTLQVSSDSKGTLVRVILPMAQTTPE